MFRQKAFLQRQGGWCKPLKKRAGNALREPGGESRRASFALQNGQSGAVS